jgi:hypothetical protein
MRSITGDVKKKSMAVPSLIMKPSRLNTSERSSKCGGPSHGSCGCSKCSAKAQTKLLVNQPGDRYEREADLIADQVMTSASTSDSKHRDSARHESSSSSSPKHKSIPSGGQPLDAHTRTFMESRFNHNFSQVRVHTGAEAAASARGYNSTAFTLGHDVVFGAGQYRPHSSTGLKLLAHELTHVVQQNGGGASSPMVQRQNGGPLPVVVVSGPAAIANVPEDAAEKNIRESGEKAEKAGSMRFYPTSGYPDFVKNAHKEVGENECASKVLINGHGGSDANSAWMTMGSSSDPTRGFGTTDIGNNAGTLVGDDVFKNFKFCSPCEVWLGGCNFAATKPGRDFMQAVANNTGCMTKAYATSVTTNPKTGWIEPAEGEGKKKKIAPATP